MSDPCDDKQYEGLKLNDFLRHFVPQMETQKREIQEVNEKGFLPFIDPSLDGPVPMKPAKSNLQKKIDKIREKKRLKRERQKQRQKK